MTKLSRIAVPVLKDYYDGKVARAKSRYSQHLVKKDMIKHRVMSEKYLNYTNSMESEKQDELITITIKLTGWLDCKIYQYL